MSKTKHILVKIFYPIVIFATNIEVRNILKDDYPSRLKGFFEMVFDDEEDDLLSGCRLGYCVDFWLLKKEILKERLPVSPK